MTYSKRNKLLVFLSFQAGMRTGEISNLKVGHVLNNDNSVCVSIHLLNRQTKGDKKRTVILSQSLQKEISKYVCGLMVFKRAPDQPLIMFQKGGAFSATTMVMLFRRIYDLAVLRDARSHLGRRSFITKLANKGVSVRVVQTLAGH